MERPDRTQLRRPRQPSVGGDEGVPLRGPTEPDGTGLGTAYGAEAVMLDGMVRFLACDRGSVAGALTTQMISRHITYMKRDGIDGEAPTLDQARRQVEHYGLDVDPQAVLVAVRLISAGARVGRAAETHFARFGLSTGRYRLLADLEDHGGEKSPSRLAADLDVTRATVTGLLDGLEREGLIARRPSTEDGRGTVAVLTARGAQRLRDMASEHFGRLEAMVGGLSIEERAVFLDLLSRVVRGSAALAAD